MLGATAARPIVRLHSDSKGKAGFMQVITPPAGGESTKLGQLYSWDDNITDKPIGLDNSENINSIQENYNITNRLPLSLVRGGIKLRELLKSNKIICVDHQGVSAEPTTESQTIHS